MIKNLDNYRRLKPIAEELSNAKNKSAFREKHRAEIIIFESSRKALKEFYGNEKWDSLKSLQAEHDRLIAEQTALYAEREKLKKQIKEVETVKGNVNRILGLEDRETPRTMII